MDCNTLLSNPLQNFKILDVLSTILLLDCEKKNSFLIQLFLKLTSFSIINGHHLPSDNVMCSNVLLPFNTHGVKYLSLHITTLLILDWQKSSGKNNEMFSKIEVKLSSFSTGFLFYHWVSLHQSSLHLTLEKEMLIFPLTASYIIFV